MLRLDSITITAAYEPPRPPAEPRRRVQTLHPALGDQPEYFEDWGLRESRRVRLVSSERQGFVTESQRDALLALYEAGEAFELDTDLLTDIGNESQQFVARFDPETLPSFTPATPGGRLYYFDLTLLVTESSEES